MSLMKKSTFRKGVRKSDMTKGIVFDWLSRITDHTLTFFSPNYLLFFIVKGFCLKLVVDNVFFSC